MQPALPTETPDESTDSPFLRTFGWLARGAGEAVVGRAAFVAGNGLGGPLCGLGFSWVVTSVLEEMLREENEASYARTGAIALASWATQHSPPVGAAMFSIAAGELGYVVGASASALWDYRSRVVDALGKLENLRLAFRYADKSVINESLADFSDDELDHLVGATPSRVPAIPSLNLTDAENESLFGLLYPAQQARLTSRQDRPCAHPALGTGPAFCREYLRPPEP